MLRFKRKASKVKGFIKNGFNIKLSTKKGPDESRPLVFFYGDSQKKFQKERKLAADTRHTANFSMETNKSETTLLKQKKRPQRIISATAIVVLKSHYQLF